MDTPPWRRPSDGRTFGRRQIPAERPLGAAPASGVPAPPASPEIPPSGSPEAWSADRSRLADILGHHRRPPVTPSPNSAPPYPYEGDLDDSYQPRAAVPTPRPDWLPEPVQGPPPAAPVSGEPGRSRHALVTDTLAQGLPRLDSPAADASAYDSPGFPRRPYEPVPDVTPTYNPPAAVPGFPGQQADDPETDGEQHGSLPQRVPAQPDVPRVPEPPSVEPSAEAPALARIATHLRRGDVVPAQERQEGFDVQDILAAVREVAGVRDASLRATPAGAHSLRLDLADGADAAEVSRQVARLLQERMGLDAAMPGDTPAALRPARSAPAAPPAPAAPRPSSAPVSSPRNPLLPNQPVRAARAAVPVAPVSSPSAPVSSPSYSPSAPVSSPAAPAPVSAAPAPAPVRVPAPAPVSAAPVSAMPHTPPAPPLETREPREPRESRELRDSRPQVLNTGAALVPADASKPRPLDPGDTPGPRVIIENVHVNTFGADATVEVRLRAGGRTASGVATGPAVDGYLLRLCATATAGAVDELLSGSQHEDGPARCFVEHAAAVSFGPMQVAVVVLLLSCGGGWVEQLAGSAVVTGDDRHAMVRATLSAVNRRLEALLA
ncbi:Daple [Actinoplanes sp. NEAU-A12]|uniref:Daple n=1 Tax=Actinoplanes sandaracinus TaxID=3045177 RepID=A0ABT6WFY2_9ACTN|nr:Daple [Actinoplanes sandaracinus]MDI6098633.1 Daple [Actinoplanes sandaracinus]